MTTLSQYTHDGQVVVFMARAELRPLLDLCVAGSPCLYADMARSTEYSS